ncbi:ABC transporter substrate-binding protein [Anaplasmataceae bacterium AB001_6]|nr:ABC transporter substrate-binding protein [Anaplasmataceae bacterium AB001_6]
MYFGMSGDFNGSSGFLGRSVSIGIKAAFEEFNSKNDIRGQKLRLVTLNDNYEAFYSKKNILRFATDNRMLGIIGSIGSPTSEAVIPIIEEKKILYFAPYSGSKYLHDKNNRYLINYRPNYIDEIKLILNTIFDSNMTIDDIAIFAQDSGNTNKESRYIDIVKEIGLIQDNITPEQINSILYAKYFRNTDYVGSAIKTITDAKKKSIKAFILAGTSLPISDFIKSMKEIYPQSYYFVLSFPTTEGLIYQLCKKNSILCEEFSQRVIVNQLVPDLGKKNDKLVSNFKDSFYKHIEVISEEDRAKMLPFELEPNNSAFEGYISARILIKALQNIDSETKINRETIIDALNSLTSFDLDGSLSLGINQYDNNFSRKIWMKNINGGRVNDFSPSILKEFENFKTSWKDFVE